MKAGRGSIISETIDSSIQHEIYPIFEKELLSLTVAGPMVKSIVDSCMYFLLVKELNHVRIPYASKRIISDCVETVH